MSRKKLAAVAFGAAALVVLLFSLYKSLIIDPNAEIFLEQKTELPRHGVVWLNVLAIHVVFACIAMLTGAINLLKYRTSRLHQIFGYLYVIAVVVVDLTSGYMAPDATGGKATSIPFNLLNAYWVVITFIAIYKASKQQLGSHRRCMIRSYMFCFTNMITHLLTFIMQDGFGIAYETSYIIAVNGSIVLLIIIGEMIARAAVPVIKQQKLST